MVMHALECENNTWLELIAPTMVRISTKEEDNKHEKRSELGGSDPRNQEGQDNVEIEHSRIVIATKPK